MSSSPAPRTILFLHPSAELYGADRTLIDLIAGLDPASHRAVVILPRRGPLVRALEGVGARVEIGPLGIGAGASLSLRGLASLAFDLPRAIVSTLRIARRHAATIVHTNTMIVLGGALGAGLLSRIGVATHIWHVHEIPTQPWLTRIFAGLFRLLADRVVANSHATARHFRDASPGLDSKLEVIWNGTGRAPRLDSDDDGTSVRRAFDLDPDQPLVLLIGRINSWKGQALLIDAAASNRVSQPEARYLIIGDCPPGQPQFAQDLTDRIQQAGLQDIVLVGAFSQNPVELFLAADLVVVPSTRPEPFGLVAIEAMACARPVIAASHGGLPEIIEHGTTGLLFKPGSSADLASAIHELLANPERASRMGQAGRERQRAYFTSSRYCADFRSLYRTVRPEPPPLPARTKIVHLTLGKANPERMNGVNVAVHNLARAQHAAGLNVEFWGITDTPHRPSVERAHPARFFQRPRLPFRTSSALADAIRSEPKPCVFHLHGGFLPDLHAAARTIGRCGHTFVFSPHGAYLSRALRKRRWLKALVLRLFERPLLRRAARVQTLAPTEARDTARQVRADRIVVIPNGQALLPHQPHSTDLTHLGPVFGFCGRIDVHTKGLDLLLEGFARHVKLGGRGSLHVIGAGNGQAQLETLASQLGIAARIHFLGPHFGDEKLALLREVDVFVLTSRHEGMPMSALEAAALGRPLLVSPGTNLAREVDQYECGYALEENTSQAICRALALAQRDHSSGALLESGRRARRMVSELFGWDQIAARTASELYKIAAPATRQGPSEPDGHPQRCSQPETLGAHR